MDEMSSLTATVDVHNIQWEMNAQRSLARRMCRSSTTLVEYDEISVLPLLW